MNRGVVPVLSLVLLSGVLASNAYATVYSAEARVFSTTSTIPVNTDSDSGTDPVSVLAGTSDPNQPGTSGAAGAIASQGRVSGVSATASKGQRLIGFAKASATFNDVLFSWTGQDGAAAPTVRVGLNYNLSFEQAAEGALGSQPGRNYRTLATLVTFNTQQDALSATFDVGGNDVSPGIGNRTLWADVTVGTPVTVRLDLEVASAAFMAALPGPTITSMFAGLRVGSVNVTNARSSAPLARSVEPEFAALSVDPTLLVFDMPEGYTANSVSMGVVDNVWVAAPVPEPAMVATMVVGLLAVGAYTRRVRRRS